MSYHKGNNNAFLLGMKFSAGMAEAQYIAAVQHSIDDETFKKDGFKTAEEFITDGQRFTSYDIFRKRSAALKQLGVELTSTLLDAGFTWNKIRMVEHLLPDHTKDSARNKNAIPIDGTDISLDNKEAIVSSIKMLIEQRDGARKDAKTNKKKLDGIDGEVKKSEKLLLKKIADLEALSKPDTPEKLVAAFEALDKMLNDFDTALRTLVFKQDWIKENPQAQARVEALQSQAEKRFQLFREDWDQYYTITD